MTRQSLRRIDPGGVGNGTYGVAVAGGKITGLELVGSTPTTLDDLTDVDLTGAVEGDFLQRDASGIWTPVAAPTGGGGGGTVTRQNFVATAGQTAFTLSEADPDVWAVSLNGLILDEVDYTVAGTTLTLDTGAELNDGVSVFWGGGGTGGGGSSGAVLDNPVDEVPGSPDPWNYEFTADNVSTPPSGWAWVNQGSSTYLERYGRGVITSASNTGYNNRILDRAVPGGATWTVDAKLTYQGRNANFWQCGLCLRDSTTGKIVMVGNDGRGPCFVNWSSPTAYAGESTHYPMSFSVGTFYVRIVKNSATSYDYGFSVNGSDWTYLFTAQNPAAFVGTVDRIGFLANAEYGAPGYPATICHWMRKVA